MAQVDVNIAGYHYPVACKDGQEAQLRDMTRKVDSRLEDVAGHMRRKSNDIRVILTACVMMENEIQDLRKKLEGLTEVLDAKERSQQLQGINKIIQELESIAEQLENE